VPNTEKCLNGIVHETGANVVGPASICARGLGIRTKRSRFRSPVAVRMFIAAVLFLCCLMPDLHYVPMCLWTI